jgi:hypothetical protein
MTGSRLIAFRSKGRNFHGEAIDARPHGPELSSLKPDVLGDWFDYCEGFFGSRVGRKIEVDMRSSQRCIPDGATYQVKVVRFVAKAPGKLQNGRVVGKHLGQQPAPFCSRALGSRGSHTPKGSDSDQDTGCNPACLSAI